MHWVASKNKKVSTHSNNLGEIILQVLHDSTMSYDSRIDEEKG